MTTHDTDHEWIDTMLGYAQPAEPSASWAHNYIAETNTVDPDPDKTPPDNWTDQLNIIRPEDEIDIAALRHAAPLFFKFIDQTTTLHIPDPHIANRLCNDTINIFNNLRERKIKHILQSTQTEPNIIDSINPDPFTPGMKNHEAHDEQQREILIEQFIDETKKNIRTVVCLDAFHGDLCFESFNIPNRMQPRGSIYDADLQKFIRIDGDDLLRALNEDKHKLYDHRFILAGGPNPEPEAIRRMLTLLNKKYDNFCLMNTATTTTDDMVNDIAISMNIDLNIVNVTREHENLISYLKDEKRTDKANALESVIERNVHTAAMERTYLRGHHGGMRYDTARYAPVFNSPGPDPAMARDDNNKPIYSERDPRYYTPTPAPANRKTILAYVMNLDALFINYPITGCIRMDHSYQATIVKTRAEQHDIPIHDFHTHLERARDKPAPHIDQTDNDIELERE